jgi:hypothetical protein
MKMDFRRHILYAVGSTAVLTCLVCGAGTGPNAKKEAQSSASHGDHLGEVPWTGLSFKASKLLMSAATGLRVELVPAESLVETLRPAPVGQPILPSSSRVAIVTNETDLPFGRSERILSWVEPGSGAALQSEKLVSGSKQYWKLRRYLDLGLYQWRAAPLNKPEKRLEHPMWTRRSARLESWDREPPPGIAIADSYALLYLISAARLDREGSEFRICLFSKGELAELHFLAGDVVTKKVSYDEVWSTGRRRRHGKLRVRLVKGSAVGAEGSGKGSEVETGFMGMRGELTLFLETGMGIPVEVHGRTESFGRLEVKLKRANLSQPPVQTKG